VPVARARRRRPRASCSRGPAARHCPCWACHGRAASERGRIRCLMGTGMTTSPEQEGCKGLYVGGLHPYVNEACLQVRIRAAPPAAAAHSPRPPVTRPRVRRFYTPAAAPFVQCCALRTPCTPATRRNIHVLHDAACALVPRRPRGTYRMRARRRQVGRQVVGLDGEGTAGLLAGTVERCRLPQSVWGCLLPRRVSIAAVKRGNCPSTLQVQARLGARWYSCQATASRPSMIRATCKQPRAQKVKGR